MVQSNLNLTSDNGVTNEELQSLIAEAYTIENELRSQLSKIKININKAKNPEIINAITEIFGPSYISSNGNSIITYDMYCSVINLIRDLGKNKAQEIL